MRPEEDAGDPRPAGAGKQSLEIDLATPEISTEPAGKQSLCENQDCPRCPRVARPEQEVFEPLTPLLKLCCLLGG